MKNRSVSKRSKFGTIEIAIKYSLIFDFLISAENSDLVLVFTKRVVNLEFIKKCIFEKQKFNENP